MTGDVESFMLYKEMNQLVADSSSDLLSSANGEMISHAVEQTEIIE